MDLTRITNQVNKIKVKNVVDMPLFYGLWVLVLALISSVIQDKEWITVVMFSFAGVLFLKAIFGYLFFTFKNPDYLRSEEYHLKKKSLEILGDNDNILPVDAKKHS
jgi:vacuolar-type H+-ATPase subunit I/STV1